MKALINCLLASGVTTIKKLGVILMLEILFKASLVLFVLEACRIFYLPPEFLNVTMMFLVVGLLFLSIVLDT